MDLSPNGVKEVDSAVVATMVDYAVRRFLTIMDEAHLSKRLFTGRVGSPKYGGKKFTRSSDRPPHTSCPTKSQGLD